MRPFSGSQTLTLAICAWGFATTWCCAEEPSRGAASSPTVATVGNQIITAADISRELMAVKSGSPSKATDPANDRQRRRLLLDQLVQRALALEYLRQRGEVATDADVSLAKSRLRQQLAERQENWESFLEKTQLDEATLDRSLLWRISWQRFLDRRLTDENLERYFVRHQADFDGTEVHVAHLVLQSQNTAGVTDDLPALRKRAAEVLGEIRVGRISFAEAVKRYSTSPTRETGGDLGFIGRHDPMPESFSRAAFALRPGQISEPVETPLGVHLIQCLEIQPGDRKWTDARAELESAVRTYLLGWAADQVRSRVKVEVQPELGGE